MIILFTSQGCSTCRNVIRDIPDSWASQIIVLRVEFDKEAGYYRVYDNDNNAVGNRAPVDAVPALCFFGEEPEAHAGYARIISRLKNGPE